ncbi:TIR domain-containing protein [Sphingomicrobium sediminis]|uniref:TIR domain-containing protein n=1 Tax=Sphingomicrobium sediminis TaxID=2950949 RepID=A0A9X2EFN9_9SPHN|nr:TIR domain-containing protein [Sphingomicrobium sediminis]MCM8556672.1 TIR domain-containing protein [Sphingomicrobium sediminis]
MSQVFISYARSTEAIAKAVGEELRSTGFEVWRDDELPAHRSYSEVIEERLAQAKAVVVLWSNEALRSQWVRAEADAAREAGTLVQMSVDGTKPPIPFNQIQCADLADWTGDSEHRGWQKIVDSVGSLIGAGEAEAPNSEEPVAATPAKRIMVLPFQNMSGDSEQEYFSDGISEDIITDLSKVSALNVVARNQAFSYKNKDVDIAAIGRDLGVSHVVEGSVRKAEGRVRITAQLIDTDACNQVWAERYDRELKDIFALQDEISKAIVAALRLKLLPQEKKAIEQRQTTDSDAYNLYLKARQLWITGNEGDYRPLELVVRICRQATAIDPQYAKALGLMALAQARLLITYDHDVDPLPAADKALALDPDNPEAHCAKALLLGSQGEHEEAMAQINDALAVDPESFEVNKVAARIVFQQGKMEEAVPYYEKSMELVESDYHGAGMLHTCYSALGDETNVMRVARITVDRCTAAVDKDPGNVSALAIGAGSLASLGAREQARQWIDRAMLLDPDNMIMRYNLACSLATDLADNERAIELLGPFFAKIGPAHILHVEADPDVDSLRDDPRFQKMMSEAKARAERPEAS